MSVLEEFKDVPNYEGLYQVSNLGREVSKESKQKNRLSHLGKKHSQESIEKMRMARKQYWQNKRNGGVN